jgi:hypothetical protein
VSFDNAPLASVLSALITAAYEIEFLLDAKITFTLLALKFAGKLRPFDLTKLDMYCMLFLSITFANAISELFAYEAVSAPIILPNPLDIDPVLGIVPIFINGITSFVRKYTEIGYDNPSCVDIYILAQYFN